MVTGKQYREAVAMCHRAKRHGWWYVATDDRFGIFLEKRLASGRMVVICCHWCGRVAVSSV